MTRNPIQALLDTVCCAIDVIWNVYVSGIVKVRIGRQLDSPGNYLAPASMNFEPVLVNTGGCDREQELVGDIVWRPADVQAVQCVWKLRKGRRGLGAS